MKRSVHHFVRTVANHLRSQWRTIGTLGGLCLLAVGVRAYYFTSVFRGEDVLLLQVDPWKYQVHIERLTEQLRGPFDPAVWADPGRAVGTGQAGLSPTGQDDLMVATLTWFAELLGGTPQAVGTVLATYPVVVAVAMCLAAYLATVWLTGERWAGLVAAGVLAITPAHAYRTALGFGDHHAFDYLWLAATFVGICYLTRDEAFSRRRWLGVTAALGLPLAGQTLSWGGSPILLVPYACFTTLLLVSTLRTDQSPISVVGPFVTSLVVAAELVLVAFFFLSWQTTTVVVLLLVQTVALVLLVGLGEFNHRYVSSPGIAAGGVAAAGAAVAFVALQRVSSIVDLLETGRAYFSRTTGTVAEATPLFVGNNPLGTVLSFFGPLFVLFVGGLLWSSWRAGRTHQPGRLAVVTYAWYFVALSAVQRRFAGELSLFFAIVVAVSLVDLSRLRPGVGAAVERSVQFVRGGAGDEQEPSRNDLTTLFVATLVAVFLVTTTVAQVPLTMENRIVTDAEYEATQRIEAHATNQDGRTGRNVFSPVNSRLMYNYYAHDGNIWFFEEKSRYAQFLVDTDDEQWHRRLTRRGTGFVVVSDSYDVGTNAAIHTKLQDNLGSARRDVSGVGQYQLIFRSRDDSTTVYALVPGARLTGQGAGNESVVVTTTVETPGRRLVYERTPRTTADGWYSVVVPYAGTYQANGEPVDVASETVSAGGIVGQEPTTAHWALDERGGTVLFDQAGKNHAVGRGLTWTPGVVDSAVAFDGTSHATVGGVSRLDARDGFTLSLWVRTVTNTDSEASTDRPRVVSTAPRGGYQATRGFQIGLDDGAIVGAVGDETTTAVLSGPRVDDGRWHHVALAWNGTVVGLYVDGCQERTGTFQAALTPTEPLVFGASTDHTNLFVGAVDDVRFRDEAVAATQLRAEFERVRDTTDAPTSQSTACSIP